MLEAVTGILEGGLTVGNVWGLGLLILATIITIALTMRIKRLVAYRWVLGNQELAVNSTWCRFGTSTSFFDAMLISISPRSVRFRAWDRDVKCFMGVQRIPIMTFVGSPMMILETRPENAPGPEPAK